jgi:hypothetical protein
VVAFGPDEPLPEGEFRLIPLAYQVVTFVVSDSNPVRQVSYAQLGGIWGEKEPLNIRQWGDLGATGAWAQRSILPTMLDDPNLLAGDVFLHGVLTNPVFSTTVLKLSTVEELKLRVHIDTNCIGLFPGVLRDTAGLHVLLVSRDAADVPFGPTPETFIPAIIRCVCRSTSLSIRSARQSSCRWWARFLATMLPYPSRRRVLSRCRRMRAAP